MNDSSPEHTPAAQAAYWRAQLSSDLVTEQQKQDFQQWLELDPENRQAWEEINAFWQKLDVLSRANAVDINRLAENDADKLAALPARIGTRWRHKPVLALAASLLFVVALLSSRAELWLADYRTGPGQLRSVRLEDGSQIMLNSESAISVAYSEAKRQITLYHGEAYFTVAGDASRPFIVVTQASEIKALGTKFNIKNRSHAVEVTVFEHAVSVTLNNGNRIDRLARGQQIKFNDKSMGQPIAADLSYVRSWHQRQIVFQDKALAEVVAELDYYRPGIVMIVGQDIKSLEVTGLFDTTDTDVALRTIEQTLPVKVSRFTDRFVLIHSD